MVFGAALGAVAPKPAKTDRDTSIGRLTGSNPYTTEEEARKEFHRAIGDPFLESVPEMVKNRKSSRTREDFFATLDRLRNPATGEAIFQAQKGSIDLATGDALRQAAGTLSGRGLGGGGSAGALAGQVFGQRTQALQQARAEAEKLMADGRKVAATLLQSQLATDLDNELKQSQVFLETIAYVMAMADKNGALDEEDFMGSLKGGMETVKEARARGATEGESSYLFLLNMGLD